MVITSVSLPKPTVTQVRDSKDAMFRQIVKRAWNKAGASGVINGHARVCGPFRAVYSMDDFLSRDDYVCGVPNQYNRGTMFKRMTHPRNRCNDSGVPATSCNRRFVADSSSYTRFKIENAYRDCI